MGRYTLTDRNGNPNVFNLEHNDNGLWLNNNWAKPDNKWNLDNQFAFRLRQSFFSALNLNSAVFLIWIIQIVPPPTKHFTDFVQFESNFLKLILGD